jgi:hypothetical protein
MSAASTTTSRTIDHPPRACGIAYAFGEAVGPAGAVADLSLLENRFQFRRYLRS